MMTYFVALGETQNISALNFGMLKLVRIEFGVHFHDLVVDLL